MTTSPVALPSIFEILKPAVGPSSSHTLGPMYAASAFARRVAAASLRGGPGRIRVTLYGSLALTGRGHLTDAAIASGLAGYGPRELAGTTLAEVQQQVRRDGRVRAGDREFLFDADRDVIFDAAPHDLPHPNTMRFALLAADGAEALAETYYSIGGGRLAGGTFGELVRGTARRGSVKATTVLSECQRLGIDLVEHVYRSEEAEYGHSRSEVDAHLDEMWSLMGKAMERGLSADGVLPGSLCLERRARKLYGRFLEQLPHFHVLSPEASLASIYAIAVAEENAAGGAVVTAPTCGSCGVVPACLRVVEEKMGLRPEQIRRALAVAGWIGAVIAADASISGAEVG
jgi:L-serine dehydratase